MRFNVNISRQLDLSEVRTEKNNITNGDEKIYINVRGHMYETLNSTLNRFPGTILGSKEKRQLLTDTATNSIYLACSPHCFDAILYYYQSNGILSRPANVRMDEFLTVCYTFNIDEDKLTFIRVREGYFMKKQPQQREPRTLREKAWLTMEEPEYSTLAFIYAVLSIVLIVISTVLNCLISTIDQNNVWGQMELLINIIFAMELTTRFILTTDKMKFTKDFLNVIDFFAIFPYLISMFFTMKASSSASFLRAFRTVKVLRLLRFSKHSQTLGSITSIMIHCLKDLVVLLVCLFLICCVSGSFEYFIEYNVDDTQFTSIPESMWWALQTVVCLGYGDIVPKSVLGKIFAMAIAIFGAITITIPLLSLGSRYLNMYTKTFQLDVGPDLSNIWAYPISMESADIMNARKKVVPGILSRSLEDNKATIVINRYCQG